MTETAPSFVFLGLVVLAVLTVAFVQRLATVKEAALAFAPATVATGLLYAQETWSVQLETAIAVAVGAQGVALAALFGSAPPRDAARRPAAPKPASPRAKLVRRLRRLRAKPKRPSEGPSD